ncbi:MAG TPA: hypothetical protein VK658_27815 [Chryseolinea sp.]|nr:hypothetical protein [Chryseolinea sp.]
MNAANSKSDLWFFVLFVIVILYSTGASFLESLVNYPLWKVIGPSDAWNAYRIGLGPLIVPVLAIPSLPVSFVLNVILFFKRPVQVPRWTVWVCLLFLFVAFVSTVAIQLPIQAKLDQGYDAELLDKLIVSDLWLRDLVSVLRVGVLGYMMYVALGGSKKRIGQDQTTAASLT